MLQWKKNVQDIGGEVLCVSQFTLLASTKKGNKPDFHGALGGDEAKRLYHYFLEKVQQGYAADKVKNGVFQAMMEVALVNDGPVCWNVHVLRKPAVRNFKKSTLGMLTLQYTGYIGGHHRIAAETRQASCDKRAVVLVVLRLYL